MTMASVLSQSGADFLVSPYTLTPSWNSTRSLPSLRQIRKHNNSFCPPQRRDERLRKHTGASGSPRSDGFRRRFGRKPPRSKDGRGDVEEAEVQTQPNGEVACGHRGWAPGSGTQHHPGSRPGSPGHNGGSVMEINSISKCKLHSKTMSEITRCYWTDYYRSQNGHNAFKWLNWALFLSCNVCTTLLKGRMWLNPRNCCLLQMWLRKTRNMLLMAKLISIGPLVSYTCDKCSCIQKSFKILFHCCSGKRFLLDRVHTSCCPG